jgi:hypothetical protein
MNLQIPDESSPKIAKHGSLLLQEVFGDASEMGVALRLSELRPA